MIYAASDIHGYPLDSFLRLLEKAGFGDGDVLYILGDVIDRNGDGGVAMLRWILSRPNVRLLMGNHEAMMMACGFLFEQISDLRSENLTYAQKEKLALWLQNGAKPTILSLAALSRTVPEEFQRLLEFLRSLKLYETVTAGGRDFLLVHSGLDHFSPDRPLTDYAPEELLWCRPSPDDVYFPDRLTVLGHTPTGYLFGESGKMFRTETWINIATGAAGGGAPMLLRLDDLQPFYA